MRKLSGFLVGFVSTGFGSLRRLALVLLMSLASLLSVNAAVAQSYQFSSFSVQGNSNIESATILSHAGISAGSTVTAADLNQAYQRVLATGLFEIVEVIPRGRRLVIRVTEFRAINRISFEGNSKLNDETALGIISSRPRLVFSPTTVEQDAAALTDAYRDQGRLSATVTPKIIVRSNNRVDVVFEVHEGRTVEVERLSFVGNRDYSDRRLRRVLATKQAGSLRALIRQDAFVEDRIEFDKSLLRDFYQSRGYVDFQTLSVTSEFSRQRNAFFVTFNIREGQKFSFGQITATSELPEVNAADFTKLARIRPGQVYSPEVVDNVIARMEKLALTQGLNLVRVDPRVTRNDRDLTLDIEFALVQGPRIFVERIDIEGNATTLDRVVRRQFRVVEGDPFNPREIREAAARIRALGLFSSASVNAREGTKAEQVIIDVDVEEQNTGSLSFGAAYNFSTGVGLTAKFKESNFLGRGQTLNFDFSLGLDNSNGGMTFIEPAFLGRDLAFRFDGEYRKTEFDYTNYDTQKINFRPSFDFPISENGRFAVRYTYANDRIFNVDAASSPILIAEEAAGATVVSAVGYTYSYDTRRSGVRPDTGILLQFGQDFAGAGGNTDFIKSSAKILAETRVLNEEVTLRVTLEGGALKTLGGVSSLTDRYFLNNSRMRGFAPAGVGPRDLTVTNQDALGGNYFAVARFEADFPLGLPEELGINGGVFMDFGSVWGLDNTNGGLVDDAMHIRSSVGFSIFWNTPVGPLRFNFSQVLRQEAYDSAQSFDLTISTQF